MKKWLNNNFYCREEMFEISTIYINSTDFNLTFLFITFINMASI